MRTTNRILATLIGLLLLVGGVLAAIEIAIAYAGGDPWVVPYDEWYRRARANSWESGGVRGLLVVVTAIGLVLLVIQLIRAAPRTLAMRSGGDPDASYEVRRRSLEKSLARRAEQVDGVESARVKIDRRAIRVDARSNRRLAGDLRNVLENAVQRRVRGLDLESEPPVRLRVHLREGES